MLATMINAAKDLYEYTRAHRRDFHKHPELGFQEYRTAGIVAQELSKLGLEVVTGVAETGVVALLEGNHAGPMVLLRFDMDALPINEETGADYASNTPGVMHACGHDGHTAIGLTVARLLHAKRHDWHGSVKLVFQPAEEGLGGAERMIADGALEDPRPQYALALHLWNEKPLGWLGVSNGPTMAAAEAFLIRLVGKGGHAAIPDLAVDPVLTAAHIVTGLQSIVARNVSPLSSAVVSVTLIQGGDAFNVIPPMVELQGTIRTFEFEVRDLVLAHFQKLVEDTAAAFGCTAEIELKSITPAVINNAEVASRVQNAAFQTLQGCEIDRQFRTMGSEDMAFIMQDIPGCYFFVGSANPDAGLDAPHHHPCFDFDEQVLWRASALMANAALELLS